MRFSMLALGEALSKQEEALAELNARHPYPSAGASPLPSPELRRLGAYFAVRSQLEDAVRAFLRTGREVRDRAAQEARTEQERVELIIRHQELGAQMREHLVDALAAAEMSPREFAALTQAVIALSDPRQAEGPEAQLRQAQAVAFAPFLEVIAAQRAEGLEQVFATLKGD